MIVVLCLGLFACGTTTTVPDSETGTSPPWEGDVLGSSEVPSVLLEQWRNAENREHCAAVAFATTGVDQATARSANFSGGWAVAWDLPAGPGVTPDGSYCPDCGRGAFGLAGTGVEPSPDTYDDWEFEKTYSDGSKVGYGPRGEQWLAYLEIAGQRCLYNVWSWRGREHLEQLIGQIRMVE